MAANVQQTFSKRPALHLLKICWTFAGSCKHPTNQFDSLDTSFCTRL